jgi:hypothetical protein
MTTSALSPRIQSLVTEFGVFWQLWPQFEHVNGDRRLVGFEVELIGSHDSGLNHVDPTCPGCARVRGILLAIADLMPRDPILGGNPPTYNIDSHSNSILFLPALGNRAEVSVSIYISWSWSNGSSFETELLNGIRAFLNGWGIHQR